MAVRIGRGEYPPSPGVCEAAAILSKMASPLPTRAESAAGQVSSDPASVPRATPDDVPELVIAPVRGWVSLGLGEVWRHRELLYFLVWRDIKVRYKQTAVGVVWAIVQPIAIVTLFTIIFGHLARLPSNGIPYPLFFYAGYLPWQMFAIALAQSSISLVSNQQLVTKVYFPRILIPVAVVIAGFVDFAISGLVLLGFYTYYGMTPTWALLALPFFIMLASASALSAGLWLSAINVRYRDVQNTLPFLTQVWFFATPIIYAVTLIPERWRLVLGINPMAGVVEGFRWSLFRSPASLEPLVGISVVVVLVVGITGALYFRRAERTFADVI
jgi:lipopolysaccharide transport system permease protein